MENLILVCGAINTDLIAYCDRAPDAGETVTGSTFEMHGGGKGANQAVAAARQNALVAMVGAVGEDDFGRARLADLAADGVATESVRVRTDAPSGVALITVEAGGENRIAYIPGATGSIAADDVLAAASRVQPTTILATNECSEETLRQLFEWAQSHHVRVVYNVAPYSEQSLSLAPFADVLVANEGESRSLVGDSSAEGNDLARRLATRIRGTAIVTIGSDGCLASDGETVAQSAGNRVEAVDTTGAGDTFCGALAAELNAGASLQDAMDYANAAASISVTRRGAQPSIPVRRDVEAFLANR